LNDNGLVGFVRGNSDEKFGLRNKNFFVSERLEADLIEASEELEIISLKKISLQ